MPSNINLQKTAGHNFGTFGGVFTPSILTIFGLIMFMRTSFVVGESGLFWALVILIVSHMITFSTGLSISAISTNTRVKGGGAYYLISRSLGPSFGSSIGVTLFFAQTLSIPFYILGFAEALATNIPALQNHFLLLALAPGLILFIVSWTGANWAIKFQFLILAILSLAILSFLAGALFKPFSISRMAANMRPADTADLIRNFAIFFPAVTGIMAGVNMSGDLRNPSKSLPLGTLLAIAAGAIVYTLQMVLSAGAFTRPELIKKPYEILVENALFGGGLLVIAGVVCATLSSALGSMLGAPRVLQALAKDRIINSLNPFEKGHGKHNEPRRALLLSFIITLVILIWGGMKGMRGGGGPDPLNMIAEIVTMFFLYTYGMVNLAAFVESFGANPSFRPRFRYYHWSTALFGAVACIGVSFLVNFTASLIALLIMGALFVITRKKQMEIRFGDARRGFLYSRIRNFLLMLSKIPPDPKNWRPTIAVFTGNPHTRLTLLEYATLFESRCGILSLVEIISKKPDEPIGRTRREALARTNTFIEENKLNVFAEVIVTDDFDSGLTTFLQAHSIGPVKPNIAMMGWPNNPERVKPFISHLNSILVLDISSVVFVNHGNKIVPEKPDGRIDIWWRGMSNGSLMLILAHLLRSDAEWDEVELRIIRTVKNEKQEAEAESELIGLVEAARIDAEVKTVVSDEYFDDTLRKVSGDAELIFLGYRPPKEDDAEEFFKVVNRRLENMPPAFLICSSGEADLLA